MPAGRGDGMPKIIVANNDNPNMYADQSVFEPDFVSQIGRISARALWFAEAGDILVLPQMLSTVLLDYAARLQRRSRDSVTVIGFDIPDSQVRGLSRDELLNPEMIFAIKAAMGRRKDWSLLFYNATHDARELAEALGLADCEAVRPFIAEGGAEILNDKRMFRNLAAGREIPLAPGVTANGRAELERAIAKYLPLTDTVIVKQDRHQGGLGNIIVSRLVDGPKLGATDAFVLGRDGSLREICDRIWQKLGVHGQSMLVVESYCTPAIVFTSEFRCTPAHGRVEFLNWGQLRQAPTFDGLIMPPSAPSYLGARFVSGATEIARLCTDLGYDGLINIDGLATDDGRIVFNEFNARLGACSHMHRIAETVAGPDYGDRLVMTSFTMEHGCIERAFEILDAHGVAFRKDLDGGIVIGFGWPAEHRSQLEIITLAPDAERALQIEQRFVALLNQSMKVVAA